MKYTNAMEEWRRELIAMLLARYYSNAGLVNYASTSEENILDSIESDITFCFDAAYSQGVTDGMIRITKILYHE